MAKTVVKVTLSSGKVVLLNEMKISHQELAAQEVAAKANGDSNLLQFFMQKALVKMLIVRINDKPISKADLENLDDLLNVQEYSQVTKVMGELLGGNDLKKPQIEVMNFGDN